MRSSWSDLYSRAWIVVLAVVVALVATSAVVGGARSDSSTDQAASRSESPAITVSDPEPPPRSEATSTIAPPPLPSSSTTAVPTPAEPTTASTALSPPTPPAELSAAEIMVASVAATAASLRIPPPSQPLARAETALVASVPSNWRKLLPTPISIIRGATSWALVDDRLQIGSYHATGRWSHLRAIVAHEFGHVIAYHFGSGEYLGAPPRGWPGQSSKAAESWADCVSRAFTGIDDPSTGLPSCRGEVLDWTIAWLAAGPYGGQPSAPS